MRRYEYKNEVLDTRSEKVRDRNVCKCEFIGWLNEMGYHGWRVIDKKELDRLSPDKDKYFGTLYTVMFERETEQA
jgi:hypothetical protein